MGNLEISDWYILLIILCSASEVSCSTHIDVVLVPFVIYFLCAPSLKLCLTPCDPSLSGSSVHGILQAKLLE